ncbi:Homeobox-leucine zipper protein HAT22 [Sesamum alatum]|uniref:Homeobox-leucine zipper protein HAT22 n=1 Tax=Sesamum alatum TaxID=300844 RepID=A0AAE1XNY5_9LAMI|nr:Homeobox-leucine zipper protein HAT22 [Sesamum alatum]
MDENDEARLGLGLGLGSSECTPKRDHNSRKNNKRVFFLDLSIPLHPSDDHDHGTSADDSSSSFKIIGDDKQGCKNYDSFSCKDQDDDSSKDFSRKKLRLTRDQITLLEDSFRQHTTLNTAQKQTLAEKLNLKPRQVEVWFQNRRARTKLKQTEVDREFLKKNCERLSEENRRLKKELTELRSLLKIENPLPPAAAPPPPFFHHNVKAAAASREKNGKGP